MTQVFQPDGTMVGVSVVQITPNTVTRLRTADRDGYTAVQLGAGERRKLTKPVAGQLKDLPRVATIREFRLDSADEYAVGQQITVADVFAEGDIVDVTGVSKGKGFAGTVKRHNFSRGPEDPRLRQLPQAGLHRPRHDAGSRLQGHEDGRPHGPRAGHGQEAARRPRGRRAEPDPRQGIGPRSARRAHLRPEGLTMPQTTLYDRTGATVGSVDLAEALFAAPVNEAVLHQAVVAQLAGRRTRHRRHQDPRRGPRRRPQAVPPEGHRPRPPGLAHRAALPRRRRRVRPAPALLRAEAAAQDAPHRAALGADGEARRRRDPRRRPRSAWPTSRRPRRSSRSSRRSAPATATRGASSSWRPRRTSRCCARPRTCRRSSVIRADSLNVVDLLNADAVLIEQPALARMEEVYA